MNPLKLMELRRIRDTFEKNHPRFFPFLRAVSQKGIQEGSIIEIQVTTPKGESFKTNLKLSASDLEVLEKVKKGVL